MVVIVTLQKDNATMIRIEGKDTLMGFTMVLGKYLLHYVSYYSCDIVATSMNKIFLTYCNINEQIFFSLMKDQIYKQTKNATVLYV
jgi:hypothetical protein